MPPNSPSGFGLFLRLFWVFVIRGAGKIPGLSLKLRAKLTRSASKRADRFLRKAQVLGSGQFFSANDSAPAVSNSAAPSQYESRNTAYKILIVCLHAPTVNHAGGLRILDMVQMIKRTVPSAYVEVFTSANKDLYGPIDKIVQLADNVVIANNYNFSLEEYLQACPMPDPFFDVVDFQFPQALDVVQAYRTIGNKLVFTPMESHIRNELIERDPALAADAALVREDALLEEQIVRCVDQTVCVSEMDRKAIADFVDAPVVAIETGISEIEFSDDIQAVSTGPNRVCYVAYFGSQTNRDALKWYLDHVHPAVLAAVPDYTFSIIGRGDITEFLTPMPAGVEYIGEVDRIGPYIKGSAVGVAPALSGSGFRGKVNQYAILGVPTVASPLSADGLAYVDGQSILAAQEPEDFARGLIRLLQDDGLRADMAAQALQVTRDNYTWDAKWPAIADVYDLPQRMDLLSEKTVHAVVPSYQHSGYIEERIRSIFAQEYTHLRVTVIDDCSTDDSDAVIRKLQEEFDFEYIRREENSGSPFTAWEYAAQNTPEDLIWICESDDAADSMFLAKLTKLFLVRDTAKIAYCGSWIVDEDGVKIGSTVDYHGQNFHPARWQSEFIARGPSELATYTRFGMIVPNMSSALIDADVFRKAFTPDIKKYRLAGDWLFIGQALQWGDIVFTPQLLNRFRKHAQTSRHRTKHVRQIVEHVSVRLGLSRLAGMPEDTFLDAARHDLVALRDAPDLIPEVKEDLAKLDPESAVVLSDLLETHLKQGIMSAELLKVCALQAPLPNSIFPANEAEHDQN